MYWAKSKDDPFCLNMIGYDIFVLFSNVRDTGPRTVNSAETMASEPYKPWRKCSNILAGEAKRGN